MNGNKRIDELDFYLNTASYHNHSMLDPIFKIHWNDLIRWSSLGLWLLSCTHMSKESSVRFNLHKETNSVWLRFKTSDDLNKRTSVWMNIYFNKTKKNIQIFQMILRRMLLFFNFIFTVHAIECFCLRFFLELYQKMLLFKMTKSSIFHWWVFRYDVERIFTWSPPTKLFSFP